MIKNKNIIVFGSSSELAGEFIKQLDDTNTIYTISLKNSKKITHLQISDYLGSIDDIIKFISPITNPIVIFFNGYLAENRPTQYPSSNEIVKTLDINYVIPYKFTEIIISKNIKIEKFIYISSFAAGKQRYKNFIYGYSKKLLEESIQSLELNSYLLIRFGKIDTLMSQNHKRSIFDIDKELASSILIKVIPSKQGIAYPNISTKILSVLVKMLPKQVIKYFKI